MSLHIDVHVNSDLVSRIEVTRTLTDNGRDPDAVNTYRWTKHGGGPGPSIGYVRHRYGDGAIALAQKVFADIAPAKPNGDNDV